MPVYDYSGEVIAAVSISTPKSFYNSEVEKLNYDCLKKCVEELSHDLGYQKNKSLKGNEFR